MSSEFRKEVFFDMETTGLSPFDSQIITIQVRVDGRNIVWPGLEHRMLCLSRGGFVAISALDCRSPPTRTLILAGFEA
jgi:hypothetical protein